MSGEIRQAEIDKRKPSALLPIMGLTLGLSFGVVAYFSAPYAVDLVRMIGPVDEQLSQASDDELRNAEYVAAAMIWFVAFSISMLLASAMAGSKTIVEKEEELVLPRGSRLKNLSERERKKYEAQIAKHRQEKLKELKKLKAKRDAERIKKGR